MASQARTQDGTRGRQASAAAFANGFLVLCTLGALLFERPASAAFLDASPGLEAADVLANRVSGYLEASALDGRVTSFPPDSTETTSIVGVDARAVGSLVVAQRFALRLGADMDGGSESTTPGDVAGGQSAVWRGRGGLTLDASLPAATGIEIFGGARESFATGESGHESAGAVTSVTRLAPAHLLAARVGLLRRDERFVVGVFYAFHAETQRAQETRASDGTRVARGVTFFQAPTIGGFGRLAFLGASRLDFEIDFINGSAVGEKADDGTPAYKDSFELGVGATIPLSFTTLRVALSYRTTAAAAQALETVATCPLATLTLDAVSDGGGGGGEAFRGGGGGSFYGLLFSYGDDVQSTSEFNARYLVLAFGLRAGLQISM